MECSFCKGLLRILSALGTRVWFRCSCCGHDESFTRDELEPYGFSEDYLDADA